MSGQTSGPLVEFCRSIDDGDWVETKDQGGSDYRLLQVSNIGFGCFRETGKFRYVTRETFDRLKCHEIRPGQVLVARMPDPVGRAWFVDRLEHPAITAVDVAIIDTDPAVLHPRFCAYLLNSPQHLAESEVAAGGTTRLRITRKQLAARHVVVPDLVTQERVVRVLGSIDDLIENNRRRIEVLEDIAQAIYREWFVHLRFPGHENATFVDSHLGPIPKGWEIAPLSRIATVTRSTVHPSERPDETFRHYSIPAYDEYRLPVVELGDEIRSGKYEVVEPCVLLSKLNPRIPRTWYFDAVSDIPAVASTEFLVLTTQPGCSLEHIYLSVSATNFQARLQALTGGTSGSHQRAKPEDVMALELVVPPPEIIDSALFWSIPSLSLQRSLIEQNARLALVRDLLLPKLVSGEIDVSDLDIDAVLEGAV